MNIALRCLPGKLLLAALLSLIVLGAGTARAQEPPAVVLVSNTGQEPNHVAVVGNNLWYAQSFCTGATYTTLKQVRLYAADPYRMDPSVSLRSAQQSGNWGREPGTHILTLTNPASFDSSYSTADDFTTTGYLLRPNSLYWILVKKAVHPSTGWFRLSATSSRKWDIGGAEGWTMRGNLTNWTDDRDYRLRMAISGVSAPLSHHPPFFRRSCQAKHYPSQTLWIEEDTPAETVIATLSAEDPDGDTLTYSITGRDKTAFNEAFDLDTATGQISVRADAELDYQTKSRYSVSVRVTDGEDESGNVESEATFDDKAYLTIRIGQPPARPSARPLTASIRELQTPHNGSDEFTFEVHFSETFQLEWSTMLNHAMTVINGTITDVRRLDFPHHAGYGIQPNRKWRITVEPGGNGTVTIVLPATTDCDARGAVCMRDGRRLSNWTVITVPGPPAQQQAANSPATGVPGITGSPRAGETLTADTSDTSGIADEDGLTDPQFTYQWVRMDPATAAETDIDGETEARYTVTAEDEGKAVLVRVAFTDDAGNEESLDSHAVVVAPPLVEAANAPATGAPAIDGTPRVGETLVADISDISGIEDEDGLRNAEVSYQWVRHDPVTEADEDTGTDIDDAEEETYVVTGDDMGKAPKARVSFTDDAGNKESLTSEATEVVTGETTILTDRPHGLEAVARSGAVVLTWLAPEITRDGADDYRIMRHRPELGEPDPLVYVDFTYTSDTTFVDSDVEPGVLYVYLVKAVVDLFSELGEASDPVEIRMPADETGQQDVPENSPATGRPGINGTLKVGQELTADTSGIADADGLTDPQFTYQWVRMDPATAAETDIDGETDAEYTVTAEDEGKAVLVRVAFTDDAGNEESLDSHAVVVAPPLVEAANAPATGAPAIDGTPRVGETLVADISDISDISDIEDEDGLRNAEASYQWVRHDPATEADEDTGTDIDDSEQQTYVVTGDDVGRVLKVRVSFIDDAGNEESLASEATEVVTGDPEVQTDQPHGLEAVARGGAVVLTWLAPEITREGADDYRIMRHRPELGEPDPLVYVDFTSTSDTTFVDTGVEPGVLYVYLVKAVVDLFSELGEASDPVEIRMPADETGQQDVPENSPATGRPGIIGTPEVGRELTAETSDISDADGLVNVTFSYRWLADDAPIDGATGDRYTLAAADEGKAIKVRVSFTDHAGNDEELTSEATAAVKLPLTAEFLDAPTGHDGSAAFTFEVRYSEPFPLAARTMLEDAITVTNGTITEARRLDNPHDEADGIQPNREWRITVEPGGYGDVVIVLPITEDCDARGAVCTADGRKLSNRTEITVPGNTPATGRPGIIGTPEVGRELTAETSDISDADGLTTATFIYRWLADDAPIDGATGDRYTLSDADRGKAIRVRVSFTDDAGNEESLASEATEVVTGDPEVQTDRPHGLEAVARGGAVVLTWLAPEITREGGDDYRIMRHRPELGEPDPLVYVDFTSTSDTTFVDTGVELGVLYVYLVKAVINFFGDLGEASDPVEIRMPADETGQQQPVLENSPATGRPGIIGIPEVGRELRADTSDISDADGLVNVTFSYRWLADDAPIDGATGDRYTLAAADEGKAIKVRVSFTDYAGNEETLTSEATAAVKLPLTAEFLDAPTGHDGSAAFTFEVRYSEPFPLAARTMLEHAITVTNGTVTEASRLDNPHDEADGIQPNREWRITVEPGGNGDVVIVLPIAEDCDDTGAVCTADGRKLSNQTEITVPGNTPATGRPGIIGTPEVGRELTADTSAISDADGLVNVTFSYRWLADDAPIADATGDRYTLLDADRGKAIRVRVTFTDDAGNEESLASEATAAVTTPFTASVIAIPESHDGQSTFIFQMGFSEEPHTDFSYKTMRDHVFTVTNGEVTVAQRMTKGSNVGWKITVRPSGGGDVLIVLPVTGDCDDAGAVCTEDGRMLSNRLELIVPGPSTPATGQPRIKGTLEVGQELTADTSGISDADGLVDASFAYQWLADDAPIAEATNNTYILTDAEVGKAVEVRVSFTDDNGNAESLTSAATSAVAAAETEQEGRDSGSDDEPQVEAPGAPQNLTVAAASSGQLAVSWKAPDSDGGSEITGYKVQWKESSGS